MLITTLLLLQEVGATPLIIAADADVIDPTSQVSYVLDPQSELALSDFVSDAPPAGSPIVRQEVNFGYQPGWIWLTLDVRNVERTALRRVLDFGVNFMDEIDVYLLSEQGTTQLMQYESTMPFSARPIQYHELAVGFTLPAETDASLLIRYFSRGGTTLPILILSQDSWGDRSRSETTYVVASYVLLGSFVLIAGLALVLTPSLRVLFYAIAVTIIITYLAQVDGLAFQWLWPEMPDWNRLATPVLAALATLAYSAFCWSHLDTARNYPRINRLILAVMLIQIATIFFAIQHVVYIVYSSTLTAVTIAVIAAYATVREGLIQLPFMLGRIGFVSAMIVIGSREILDFEITYATSIEAIRYAGIWEAAMIGLAIILYYKRLRQEHHETQRRQIQALEANLVMQNRFRNLESRADLAARLAESRQQKLADATHDIRQPMYSLRLAIREMMDGKELTTDSLESVSRSFEYLESLVDEYLDSGLEDMSDFDSTNAPEDAQPSHFPVNVVLDATEEMFAGEAKDKDIALHVMRSVQMAAGNPMVLLRIVNNFVSNAIKYCESGDHVLVGLKRIGGKRFVAVYDSGPGIGDDDRLAIEERLRRGEFADQNPEGKGIGLSIVASLAAQNELEWIVRSTPGRGSLFAIELNVAE